jgi:DNA-binding transcriptional LysR family regulator
MSERDRWHGIEFRHLAALAAIAKEHSFSRAADSLGYSQSAVSQQMLVLERIVGQDLVIRPGGPRPVQLTAAGSALVAHAEAVIARLAAARTDLNTLGAGAPATLSVGCYQSAGARILAPLLNRFRSVSPDVRLTVREGADDGLLLDAVERGELDLAFVVFPLQDGPFEAVELLSDPYVLLVPSDSELAVAGTKIQVRQLARQPLIGFRSIRGVHLPETRLGARVSDANIVFRSDDDDTIRALVAEGIGAAVIPWLSYNPRDERLAAVPIAVPERVVGLAWHRERTLTAAAGSFIEIATTIGSDLNREVELWLERAEWSPAQPSGAVHL